MHACLPTFHWPELNSWGPTFLQGEAGASSSGPGKLRSHMVLLTLVLCHKLKDWGRGGRAVKGVQQQVEVKDASFFLLVCYMPSAVLHTLLRAKGLQLFHTLCHNSTSKKFTLFKLSRFVFYWDLVGIPLGLPACPSSPQEFGLDGSLSCLERDRVHC